MLNVKNNLVSLKQITEKLESVTKEEIKIVLDYIFARSLIRRRELKERFVLSFLLPSKKILYIVPL